VGSPRLTLRKSRCRARTSSAAAHARTAQRTRRAP
jgi:hypothetical protein